MTVTLKLNDLFKALFHFGWDGTKPGLWTLDWTMDWTPTKWLKVRVRDRVRVRASARGCI